MTPEKKTDGSSCSSDVAIQTSAQSVPSTPFWFSEVTADSHTTLDTRACFRPGRERVRFARRRFGHYEPF
jgi:hypothetical protein